MTEIILAGPLTLALHWKGQSLAAASLCFSRPGDSHNAHTPLGLAIARDFENYTRGQIVVWPQINFDLSRFTDFGREILANLAAIPHGKTLSYAELAALSGRPKAARAVGNVMAANPYPLLLPCHRVLASSGGLGGYGPGLDVKTYLLRLEGSLK